uniref:Putative bel-1 dta-i n=1 Tax=Nyssomyia neivai TaxID=330878 RepID=A0A1L8DJ10_9DIPT
MPRQSARVLAKNLKDKLKEKEQEIEMMRKRVEDLSYQQSKNVPLPPTPDSQDQQEEQDLDDILFGFDNLRNSSKPKESQSEIPSKKGVVTMTAEDLQSALVAAVNAGKEQKPVTPAPDVVQMMERLMMRQSVGTDTQFFDGSVQDWPLFYAWYNNLTKTCQYADAEKLALLQRCLKGEAKETVRFLLFSPENVNLVVSTLEERYGRPEHLIRSMIAQVKAMPPVKAEKPETLVKFSVALSNMVAAVEQFNRNCYIDNPQLLDELLVKLPLPMQISWSEFCVMRENMDMNVKVFSAWIAHKAKAANYRYQATVSTIVEKKPDKGKTVATVTEPKKEDNPPKMACVFCEGNHASHKCDEFKNLPVSERMNVIKDKKFCFNCLKPGHSSRNCRVKTRCPKPGCGKRHHILLHMDADPVREDAANQEAPQVEVNDSVVNEPPSQKGAEEVDGVVAHFTTPEKILMKILPVNVTGPNGTIKTYAFLDEGATITLMKQSLAMRLGVTGPNVPLTWQGATPETCIDTTSRKVECRIQGGFPKAKRYYLKDVRTIANLSLPGKTVDMAALCRKWKHLEKAPVASMEDAEPEMLIGLDNLPLVTSLKVIKGPWDAPYLVRTLLGWVVLGKMSLTSLPMERVYSLMERHDELIYMVKMPYSIKSHEEVPLDKAQSHRSTKTLWIMEQTMCRDTDERYESSLLWKQVDSPKIPELKEIYMKRMYSELMDERLRKRHLVSHTKELKDSVGNNWYLRVAKTGSMFLNDLLLSDYNDLKTCTWKLEHVSLQRDAVTVDIREMICRVHVRQENTMRQQVHIKGMARIRPPQRFQLNVILFVAVCYPRQTATVKYTNEPEFEDVLESVTGILHHTYKNDDLECADTIEEKKKLIQNPYCDQNFREFDVVHLTANPANEIVLRNINNHVKNAIENKMKQETFYRISADVFVREVSAKVRKILDAVKVWFLKILMEENSAETKTYLDQEELLIMPSDTGKNLPQCNYGSELLLVAKQSVLDLKKMWKLLQCLTDK